MGALVVTKYHFEDFALTEKVDKTAGFSHAPRPAQVASPGPGAEQNYLAPELRRNQRYEGGAVIKRERLSAEESGFRIMPAVELHRGMRAQAQREHQEQVKREVEGELSRHREQAWQEGRADGEQAGREAMARELRGQMEQEIAKLADHVKKVQEQERELLLSQKHKVCELIKTLVKWVILRELKNDDNYLERLLEKLIVELNAKSHLLVKVSPENFDQASSLMEILKTQFLQINNTRVEVMHQDWGFPEKGIVLESENGILDGTLKTQFSQLNKLFLKLDDYEQQQ